MTKHQKIFYDFLLEQPDFLKQNWISIDLLPDLKGKPVCEKYDERELLLLKVPNIESYLRSGYNIELREKRYLTILVAEMVKIKRDIKIYLINKDE